MELLKSFFSKDTERGRAVRTGIQAALAVLSFLYGFITIPGLGDFLASSGIVTAGTFVTWVGVVSYLYNKLEQFFDWLGGDGA